MRPAPVRAALPFPAQKHDRASDWHNSIGTPREHTRRAGARRGMAWRGVACPPLVHGAELVVEVLEACVVREVCNRRRQAAGCRRQAAGGRRHRTAAEHPYCGLLAAGPGPTRPGLPAVMLQGARGLATQIQIQRQATWEVSTMTGTTARRP